MAHAYIMLRAAPAYRRDAFAAGFERLGYRVRYEAAPPEPGRGDVLVIWNRYGAGAAAAGAFERAGEAVLVAENGYLGHDRAGRAYYALARDGHNGTGRWPVGGPERWRTLGRRLQPWRRQGRHVLVCGQRGFGYNPMAMPDDWPQRVAAELRQVTDRPLWFRPHPARRRRLPGAGYDRLTDFTRPLAADLKGAWAAVVWSSNAATEALLAGCPAFYLAPHIVTAGAAEPGLANLEAPSRPERRPVFERLAWAQWSVAELATGTPLHRLLCLI